MVHKARGQLPLAQVAGQTSQGTIAIAIGSSAGQTSQGRQAIAIGSQAGLQFQDANSIAIGLLAGQQNQNTNAIAIGNQAGSADQSNNAIAIGTGAGSATQQPRSVAIGYNAGLNTQGTGAIAIGNQAGTANQKANSIIINADTGAALNNAALPGVSNWQVNPIRQDVSDNILYYHTTTKEITYGLPSQLLQIPTHNQYMSLSACKLVPTSSRHGNFSARQLEHESGLIPGGSFVSSMNVSRTAASAVTLNTSFPETKRW